MNKALRVKDTKMLFGLIYLFLRKQKVKPKRFIDFCYYYVLLQSMTCMVWYYILLQSTTN